VLVDTRKHIEMLKFINKELLARRGPSRARRVDHGDATGVVRGSAMPATAGGRY